MDVKAIRLENLRVLVQQAGSIAEAARKIGTSEKYLWQILNGVRYPSGLPRGVGDKLARDAEVGFSKPKGWMDAPHEPGLSGEDADFLESVRARLADRDLPGHVRQSIMLLLESAPKKGQPDTANDPNGPADQKKGSGT